jgi:hypothetical protein
MRAVAQALISVAGADRTGCQALSQRRIKNEKLPARRALELKPESRILLRTPVTKDAWASVLPWTQMYTPMGRTQPRSSALASYWWAANTPELVLSAGAAGVVCFRQTRITSRTSGRLNLVSLVSGSPAFAFIGRTIVASFTPGRMRRNTPLCRLGPGFSDAEAIRNSPFGFIWGTG